MSRKSRTNTEDRRAFLKRLAAAGGASAAVALAGRSAVAAPAEDAEPDKPVERGYHETPHIRTYYSKARL